MCGLLKWFRHRNWDDGSKPFDKWNKDSHKTTLVNPIRWDHHPRNSRPYFSALRDHGTLPLLNMKGERFGGRRFSCIFLLNEERFYRALSNSSKITE